MLLNERQLELKEMESRGLAKLSVWAVEKVKIGAKELDGTDYKDMENAVFRYVDSTMEELEDNLYVIKNEMKRRFGHYSIIGGDIIDIGNTLRQEIKHFMMMALNNMFASEINRSYVDEDDDLPF